MQSMYIAINKQALGLEYFMHRQDFIIDQAKLNSEDNWGESYYWLIISGTECCIYKNLHEKNRLMVHALHVHKNMHLKPDNLQKLP